MVTLGLYPLVTGSQVAYAKLVVCYLAISFVWLVSCFIDKSRVRSKWINLVVEIILGVVMNL